MRAVSRSRNIGHLAFPFALVACFGGTSPRPAIEGTYALATIGGVPLPATTAITARPGTAMVGAGLVISADGSFTFADTDSVSDAVTQMSHRSMAGGVGDWSFHGNILQLTPNDIAGDNALFGAYASPLYASLEVTAFDVHMPQAGGGAEVWHYVRR